MLSLDRHDDEADRPGDPFEESLLLWFPQRSILRTPLSSHVVRWASTGFGSMNDPGLDEPIAENAKEVEDHYDSSDSDILDDDNEIKSFLLPARWWYASTAFPMIAGTFGPMANTFSICALVQYWRVEIPPNGTEGHGKDIKDPTW